MKATRMDQLAEFEPLILYFDHLSKEVWASAEKVTVEELKIIIAPIPPALFFDKLDHMVDRFNEMHKDFKEADLLKKFTLDDNDNLIYGELETPIERVINIMKEEIGL